MDNAETEDGFRKEVKDIRSAIDFRDIFRWDNAMQKRRLDDVTKSLSHHDVINLQFTRYADITSENWALVLTTG